MFYKREEMMKIRKKMMMMMRLLHGLIYIVVWLHSIYKKIFIDIAIPDADENCRNILSL